MKFGKRIRTELSPSLQRGSLDYKALKRAAKTARHTTVPTLHQHYHHHADQNGFDAADKIDHFFPRLEAEKEKVSEFYRGREAWCFLALERTRGSLFGLTRWASQEGRLSSAANTRETAGEVEGRFLEANAGASALLAEARDLVKFVDMNMHAFRKVLKKLDKWTGGDRGRTCFNEMMQTQLWISGGRAHGVLRMATAMADHLRSIRPALALGPAAGGPSWADRIVYSIGSFDRPRKHTEAVASFSQAASNTQGTSYPSTSTPSAKGFSSTANGSFAYGSGSASCPGARSVSVGANAPPSPPSGRGVEISEAAAAEVTEGSRLRFLREFGAVVVVGVYTDAAHAACHGGEQPVESLEDRMKRVRPHADRVVAVDSPDSARVRETLLGASAGAAAAAAAICEGTGSCGCWHVAGVGVHCRNGGNIEAEAGDYCGAPDKSSSRRACDAESSFITGSTQVPGANRGISSIGLGAPPRNVHASVGGNNCCFVTCDWDGQGAERTQEGRRASRDTRAAMEQSMPVFRLPSPTWARGLGDNRENEGGRRDRFW